MRRSEPKLQKFDAVEIMDGRGVKMYENDAKLQNDWKVKLDRSKQDKPRMDEGYENWDVWTEMWTENMSQSAQMKSEELVSL